MHDWKQIILFGMWVISDDVCVCVYECVCVYVYVGVYALIVKGE